MVEFLNDLNHAAKQDAGALLVIEANVEPAREGVADAIAGLERVMHEADSDPAPTKLGPAGCFVAGTLVRTKAGLVPIDQIKVGDLVLSRPETGGDLGYKRVVSTVSHGDKQLWLVTYFIDKDTSPQYLVCTGNHPYWTETDGWLRADLIAGGVPMQTWDGGTAWGYSANKVLNTDRPGVGWTHYDDGTYWGPTIDLRSDRVVVTRIRKTTPEGAGSELLTGRVYDFEVDEFRSYFVGEQGVWVHSTICPDSTQPPTAEQIKALR